ncbi:MAG: hypothetical protein HY245_05390 [Rhizobiales bacterium]|nr:hypothetical protein [Hyphomicrobiales bacterium]MBI3672847.1 hypothetical protein [Hyphomicrobiales bacterium]
MLNTPEALQYEIGRLRDIVERQYLELAWQQSELRSRGGKAKVVRFGAGDLARTNLAGNAALLRDTARQPSPEAWPTGPTPASPLIANCGFASYTSGRADLAAIGISVCGLDEASVEHVVGMVEERLRKVRNFRPVFLMDVTRTEIFRRRGLAYEYVPPADGKDKRQEARLAAFNARRVEFLKRKWGFTEIINFGAKVLGQAGATGSLGMLNSTVERIADRTAQARLKHQTAQAS